MHLDRTFYSKKPYDNEMAQLFWKILPIERAAALFFYHSGDDQSRIILDIKYNDRPDVGLKMGSFAVKEMKEDNFFDDIDAVIPVPLARNRLRQRGYNQSEMIAKGICEETGIPLITNAVKRDAFMKSQTHLTPAERDENVKGIFHLQKPEQIRNKHILVVDDVCTSGATVRALGEELCKEEGVRISVFTLGFAHS